MTPLDVLARALHDYAFPNEDYDTIPDLMRQGWGEHARVVADRMAEVGGEPETPPTPTLATAVEMAAVLADQINTAALDGIPDADWIEALRILHRLRDALDTLRSVDAGLVRHIYLTGEHGDTDVPGLGRVKVARGRDRRDWDGRAVVQAVLDKQMEKRGGEMPNEPWEVAEWLLEVLPVDRPRITPLRALGLDPKAFCTDRPGPLGVQLPTRK